MIQFTTPEATAPDGSVIGVILEGPFEARAEGAVQLGPGQPVPREPGAYILYHAFAMSTAVEKARAASQLLALRRAGATIVMVSHDEALLETCSDEIWWMRGSRMITRGDPAKVLAQYRRYVAAELRATGNGLRATLAPAIRSGDGRASIENIELLGENDQPSVTWRSGENAAIRVRVRFGVEVDEPVIGIMIRTRIGLNVYGTNTELEGLRTGPVGPGEAIAATFQFRCDLCPGDYTVTAASHDADGVWHDWMEDAVAFNVVDTRYTAGVANLRAKVSVELLRK